MEKEKNKIRLYVEESLAEEKNIDLNSDQAHYLANVMKQKLGSRILCFDNQNGEFEFEIEDISRKSARIKVLKKTREYEKAKDLWLLFAPLKKDSTDFVIQTATELGVGKIVPTITIRTISDKTKTARFVAQAIEASEQSRRVDLPQIEEATKLDVVLKNWDKSRKLYFMDETGNGKNLLQTFAKAKEPCAILIGPEGGFDKKELENLRKLEYTEAVSMGKRILKAETAAITAIACWQAIAGDWN